MDGFPRTEDLIGSIAERHASDPHRALTAARELSDELTASADGVLGHFVAAAREAGMTWSDIGDALGVSKQAVQKRFAVRLEESHNVIGPRLFSRFDGRLSEALIKATLRARADGANLVTAGHLLGGLGGLRDGRATAIIQSLAPDFAATLTASLPRSTAMLRRDALPFSADARAAFRRLEVIAEDKDLATIGTEHLLLALAGDVSSHVGARLQGHGVTAEKIEQILS